MSLLDNICSSEHWEKAILQCMGRDTINCESVFEERIKSFAQKCGMLSIEDANTNTLVRVKVPYVMNTNTYTWLRNNENFSDFFQNWGRKAKLLFPETKIKSRGLFPLILGGTYEYILANANDHLLSDNIKAGTFDKYYDAGSTGKSQPGIIIFLLRETVCKDKDLFLEFVRSLLKWHEKDKTGYKISKVIRKECDEIFKKFKSDNVTFEAIKEEKGAYEKLLRAFLIVAGIGFDCSAFVVMVLRDIMDAAGVSYNEEMKTLGSHKKNNIKSNATTLSNDEGSKYLFELVEKRAKVTDYNKLRAGDIITKDAPFFHIYIISEVNKDENGKAISMTTIDCSSKEKVLGINIQTRKINNNGTLGELKSGKFRRPKYFLQFYR